jgi:hypothetical protein
MILIQPRLDEIHILNDAWGSRSYYTLCDLNFPKEITTNIFAADLPIDGICQTCYRAAQVANQDNLSVPRYTRSSLPSTLTRNYNRIQRGTSSIEYQYWELDRRDDKFTRHLQLHKGNNVNQRKRK